MKVKCELRFGVSKYMYGMRMTYLSSSRGTPPERLFDERSTSIGLRADMPFKKVLGIEPTRLLSGTLNTARRYI